MYVCVRHNGLALVSFRNETFDESLPPKSCNEILIDRSCLQICVLHVRFAIVDSSMGFYGCVEFVCGSDNGGFEGCVIGNRVRELNE